MIPCLCLLVFILVVVQGQTKSSIGRKFSTLRKCESCCTEGHCICVSSGNSKARSRWTCTSVDCGIPPSTPNGNVHATSTELNGLAFYSCDCGYELVGQNVRKCQSDSTWSGSLPSCMLKECDALTAPANGGLVLAGGLAVGAEAIYSCEDEYYLDGPQTRNCLLTGTWSSSMPFCVPTNADEKIICETNSETISCDTISGTMLHITYANYGRLAPGDQVCFHNSISDLNCVAPNSMAIVAANCEGQVSCVLTATNSIFGDPCPNTYKYLEVKYECKSL